MERYRWRTLAILFLGALRPYSRKKQRFPGNRPVEGFAIPPLRQKKVARMEHGALEVDLAVPDAFHSPSVGNAGGGLIRNAMRAPGKFAESRVLVAYFRTAYWPFLAFLADF